jgi:hypothetical protein
MPAAPQPHACSPSHGRSSCISHTHAMSRQRAHFTVRHRIDGLVIGAHDQPPPLILRDLELGYGRRLGGFLIGRVHDAEFDEARPHHGRAPRPELRGGGVLLWCSHHSKDSPSNRAIKAAGWYGCIAELEGHELVSRALCRGTRARPFFAQSNRAAGGYQRLFFGPCQRRGLGAAAPKTATALSAAKIEVKTP